MRHRNLSLLMFCSLLQLVCLNNIQSQNSNTFLDSIQIVFYNVENLFDASDNNSNGDDAFTLKGERRWSLSKYRKKINLLSQAIITFSSYQFPEILALAEIENRKVLDDLINSSLLKSAPYKIIHKDSPDRRGIDVGIIYDTNSVYPLYVEFIPVCLNSGLYSRDILYLKASINNDSLHFFVNHWPSRFTGARNTDEKRAIAAKTLLAHCDSILKTDIEAKIILMGDFNDEPDDLSLKMLTENEFDLREISNFTNLMKDNKKDLGTLKYQGQWFTFDQFIVSNSLFSEKPLGLNIRSLIAGIDFLIEEDKKYLGVKPFRTFIGFKYNGGYSDHLPIKLVLKFEEKLGTAQK